MPAKEEPRTEQRQPVALPQRLVSRVEARLPYTEFDAADEWITYALEEVLVRVEATADDHGPTVTEEEIERRLDALGYLNR